MAGTASKDDLAGDVSSPLDGMSTGQNCQAGDLLAEWRSSEQVENDTPSTSPPYWDTDDGDDDGPKPSELYGKFTWKIESFSQITKRELRSNAFEVGGYKWYILIYPQGCDVSNHLSLFLCVANHDRLLPGWSHFAQFTIAVVNKDPKKSKYSDTLHRFWKKEHDWGWKKFMELSKIVDGFVEADTLVIKAQVQVLREKANRPFRCLDRQYRRELVRVYLSNVENICRRFIEERRGMLSKLMEDSVGWSGLRQFWITTSEPNRRFITRDKTEVILKVIVKHFFIEKEVTSTLVMDSLYSGLRALEWQSESKKGSNKPVENEEMPAPIIHIVDDMFILARDAMVLLETTALEPLPPKDEKGTQSQSLNQNRTKEGNSSEEFSKDSVERDEKRLTELGRRTLEIFVLTHIFSSKIEVAYQEVVALKRQEELIREEEAAGQAEHELKAKRIAAEKEKRAKKKQGKHKRNNRKGKDRSSSSKPNHVPTDTSLQSAYHEKTLEDFEAKSEDAASENIEILDDVSDVSDTGAEVTEIAGHLESGVWDTDVSEVISVVPTSNSEMQNDRSENKCRSTVDDSSSTCSTESVPSVVIPIPSRDAFLQENKELTFSRGRNRRNKVARKQTSHIIHNSVNQVSDTVPDSGHLQDATNHSRKSTSERVVPLNDQKEQGVMLQNKQSAKDSVDQSNQQQNKADLPLLPSSTNSFTSSQRLVQVSENDSVEPIPGVELSSGVLRLAESSSHVTVRSSQSLHVNKLEKQKVLTVGKVAAASGTSSPMSRPSSAPLVPDLKPTASLVSSDPVLPFLSRSVSAFGRLGVPEGPPPMHNYAPLSYRNAIIGKSAAWSDSMGCQPGPSSSSKGSLYSQPASVTAVSSTASPAWSDQIPLKPASSFISGSAKVLVSGSGVPGGPKILGASSFVNDVGCHTDFISGSEETISGLSDRLVQGSATDEFPHLDIINYLLDEDSMDAESSAKGRTFFRPSWPYGVRHNLPETDVGSSNTSCLYDGPDQYYGDMSNGLAESIQGLDGGRDCLSREADTHAYFSSEVDGWMFGQWPLGASGSSLLSGNGTTPECSPLSYQLQDYSNLACSGNGYIMYPHANGF